MVLTAEDITTMVSRFQGLLGKGNGSMTIHFAGGAPKKVKVDMDGDAVIAASQRTVRIVK